MNKLHITDRRPLAAGKIAPVLAGAILVSTILFTPMLLHAATATFRQGVGGYTGTADNHLNAAAATTSQGANQTVLTDNDNPVAHGLLMFTNIFGSGPGQVPLNATITSASLTLRTDNVGNQCNFHRMLVFWDEASTWNSMTAGLSADDVEMGSTIEFSITGATVGQVDTMDVTAIVQGWFAGTFPNYGWGSLPTGTDGWQYNSSEHATVDFRPLLTIVFEAPCSPISIFTQPTGGMVNEGGTFTLSVVSAGTDLTYQWFKDGSPLTDATNSFLSFPVVRRTDEGTYRVHINNPCTAGGVDSANALLDVIPDEIPPAVACAFGSNDNVTVFVYFTEPVTNALSATSYAVTPAAGGDNLAVMSAAYASANQRVIALTLNATTPMAAGIAYNLQVSGVEDLFGNVLNNSPAVPIARFLEAQPFVTFNAGWRYNALGVDLVTNWQQRTYDDSSWSNGLAILAVEDTIFPNSLAIYPINTTLSLTPPGGGPQVNTYYFRHHFTHTGPAGFAVFALRAIIDDGMVIYVNGVEVHRDGVAANHNYGTSATSHEADHIDGYVYVCANVVTGDNVIAVEVHQTSATSTDIVMGVEVSSVVARLEPVVITQEPVGGTRNEGESITFTVAVSGTNPRYQWFKDGSQIPDATNATYTIAVVRTSDAGQYRVDVSNDIPSMDTSVPATLTVVKDMVPPAILCAYFGPSNDIFVVFSEIVTNAIDDPFGYTVAGSAGPPELTIATQSYTSGTNFGTTVTLALHVDTPRFPGASYTLATHNISDRFGNLMGDTTVPIAGFPRTVAGLGSEWRYNSATNLGTTWIPKLYNDSGWASGAALFDGKTDALYPSGYTNRPALDGQPVYTHISISNETGTASLSAVYFRTHFNYSGSASAVLCFRHFVDDGVVYYLNGVEILREFMPSGVITNRTLATRTEDNANFEGPVYACVSNLMSGDNVLAAEVHQVTLTSSDITFGAEVTVLQNIPPSSLTISQSGGMVTLSWAGPGGSVLEAAPSVTGPWSSGGVNQSQNQTFAPAGDMRFFRVREP